jgi:uncharacterized membrane protein
MKRTLLWLLIGGAVYYMIEGIWNGYAHIVMALVGGICFLLVGGINQLPVFFTASMRLQALIGTAIVLCVEYISGLVINVWLGMNIWDYADMPFNIHGQICLLFAFLWFLLVPFGIWLEDFITLLMVLWLRHKGKPESGVKVYEYTLFQAYKELIGEWTWKN